MWHMESQITSPPGPAVEVEGDLVAHGARGDEEGRLHAHRGGGLLLQPADRGVLAEDVVAHLGRRPWPGASRRRGG